MPTDVEEYHSIPLEDLQFEIEDLLLDLDNIRFDVLFGGLIPIYSWQINISSFTGVPSFTIANNYQNIIPVTLQTNNNTLFYLDGVYPLGSFIITIYLSGNISLPVWAIFLTLLSIIALVAIPWVLIASSSRKRRNEEQAWRTTEE
jgi:hypothetical protein